jgi:hypothetical protein
MKQNHLKTILHLTPLKHARSWYTFLYPLATLCFSTALIGMLRFSWLCKFLNHMMTFVWIRQSALLRTPNHLSSSDNSHQEVVILGIMMLVGAVALVPMAALAVSMQLYGYQKPTALVFYLLTFGSNAAAFMLVNFIFPQVPSFLKHGLVQVADLCFTVLFFHGIAHVPFTSLYSSLYLVPNLVMMACFILLQAPFFHEALHLIKNNAQKCSS